MQNLHILVAPNLRGPGRSGVPAVPGAGRAGQPRHVAVRHLGLRWEQTGKLVAENTARIEKVETKVEKLEARGDTFENELKKTKDELEELKKSMIK